MKLILDQNLSHRLVRRMDDLFSEVSHVSFHGLESSSDFEVWSFARENSYTIVSKDSDLANISLVRGFPPSIVLIGRGNCSTADIELILRRARNDIEKLHETEGGILILR